MTRTAEEIHAELSALADELEPAEANLAALYARRVELYVEARTLDPKPTVRQLAEWARSTEGAVNQVLGKHARAQDGRPRRRYGGAPATA